MEELLAKINTSAINFLVPQTPEETFKSIVTEAKKLINAQAGSIFLERNGQLQRVYTTDPIFFKVQIRKRANTYKAYTKHKVIVAYRKETVQAHPQLKPETYQTFVFIPLFYKKKSVGVLNLYMYERETFSK